MLFNRQNLKTIEDYMKDIPNKVDHYTIDEKNLIVVTENTKTKEYIMTHYKLEDNQFRYVKTWNLDCYYFPDLRKNFIIDKYHLFLVRNGRKVDAIYNYEEERFIINQGVWNNITPTNQGLTDKYATPYVNYLETYQGFVAYFILESDRNKDAKSLFWDNPYTQERMHHSFHIIDNPYFAIIDIDGTIRENKLFQGNSFSEIEKIINLNEYDSLEQFKKVRTEQLNQQSFIKSQEYYQRLQESKVSFVSPYQEQEVLKILTRKKN